MSLIDRHYDYMSVFRIRERYHSRRGGVINVDSESRIFAHAMYRVYVAARGVIAIAIVHVCDQRGRVRSRVQRYSHVCTRACTSHIRPSRIRPEKWVPPEREMRSRLTWFSARRSQTRSARSRPSFPWSYCASLAQTYRSRKEFSSLRIYSRRNEPETITLKRAATTPRSLLTRAPANQI